MAEKTLRVPLNNDPEHLNKSAELGSSLGLFAGSIGGGLLNLAAALVVPPVVAPLVSTLIQAGGAFMGASIGRDMGSEKDKERTAHEQVEGKEVNPPTLWNRSIVNAMASVQKIGLVASIPVAAIMAVGAVSGIPSITTIGTVAAVAVGVTAGIAGIVAPFVGAFNGKARMEKEYQEAQEYVAQHGEYKGKGQEQAVSPEKSQAQSYTVTPEEAKLLETRLTEGKAAHGDISERILKNAVQGAPNVTFS